MYIGCIGWRCKRVNRFCRKEETARGWDGDVREVGSSAENREQFWTGLSAREGWRC